MHEQDMPRTKRIIREDLLEWASALPRQQLPTRIHRHVACTSLTFTNRTHPHTHTRMYGCAARTHTLAQQKWLRRATDRTDEYKKEGKVQIVVTVQIGVQNLINGATPRAGRLAESLHVMLHITCPGIQMCAHAHTHTHRQTHTHTHTDRHTHTHTYFSSARMTAMDDRQDKTQTDWKYGSDCGNRAFSAS